MKQFNNFDSAVLRSFALVMFVAVFVTVGLDVLHAADEQPFGIDHRIPWTTSRVIGSPDPPLPYTVEKTFTNIKWQQPIFITPEPGTDRLFVIQQGGEKDKPSRILLLRDDPSTDQIETFLAVSNRLVYSFTFHPGYRTNGFIYVFSNGTTSEQERTNRIARFTVERQPPYRCDPKSEQAIIEWHSRGHDGGGIVFGHDGMLYISSGDGTSDSDEWVTGQDLSDLNGGILRIDVDHEGGTQPYSVPKDNPFVGMPSVRPENWAYGLRNPWRLAIDPKTGQIWVGNGGQDLWETAHLVRRGENYGWSVYEGSHPFYFNRKLGPTPVVLPTIEHSHSESRSLTGGAVYRGTKLSELDGVYVYGDYSTGKIWGTRHDGERVTWQGELANTELQITAFAVDQRGQLLITDHTGNIYRLVRSTKSNASVKFPARLSETGLFLSTKEHKVQPGVIPYSVNAPAWTDGASAQRFIALPDDARVDYSSSGSWSFTNGVVLVQTLSLEREANNPASRQWIETRLLTRQSGQWAGYSYRWDEEQSDALLVQKTGEEREFVIQDRRAPGGARQQVWRYPGRAECSACHSRAANFVLGLTEQQMNKTHDYGGAHDNQLRTLHHIGLFTNALPKPPAELTKQADPYDASQGLEARARSYLHVNCSGCHVEAGGGNSKMVLSLGTKSQDMNLVAARPQHDTFGIDNAMLIAPGDPDRSILLQRLSRRGRGQMPPLVISTVDEQAVALFRDWISDMKPEQQFVRDWKIEDLLPSLDKVKAGRSFESGKVAFKRSGCDQCHRFAGEGGSVGPDLTGVGKRLPLRDLLESVLLPSKVITEGFAATEIETKSGEITNGRVVREDEQVVVVLPQTATAEAVSIRKTDIRRRELSKVSNMPTGVLNTLQETQILDLLAYVISDGNPDHVAFDAVDMWLTNPDKSALFQRQEAGLFHGDVTNRNPTIDVDGNQTFQTMDGFGYTLTGGSAQHIIRMSGTARAALLKELFATDGTNIGTSYLRLSIGASDLNDHVFSYDDLPAGQTDSEMNKFSLEPDRADVIPVLKEILAINPAIKLLGSPWSAPAWMKTNHDSRGGSLKPESYDAYAKYFVKYIQGMKAEGIRIDAITVQNEPLHDGNNPSMLMLASDQAKFIKDHLGPAFKEAKTDTKIILYDHNADRPDYPISILNDPKAKKYVDGSAFHFYGGKIEALTQVHNAHPDKHIYFTEQWVGAPGDFRKDIGEHIKNLTIGATRNWSRNVLEWNLAADLHQNPHTDRGGCESCLGAITIDGDKINRNPAYYIVAHAAKFVRPGSMRIASNYLETLPNVAFKTPDGHKVLIVLNDSQSTQTFNIRYRGKVLTSTLNGGAVATYVW